LKKPERRNQETIALYAKKEFQMGLDIGGIFKSAVEIALPIAAEIFCPGLAAMPGVNNLLMEMGKQGIQDFVGEVGPELGLSKKQVKQFQDLVGQACDNLQNPVEKNVMDWVKGKAGGACKDLIDDFLNRCNSEWEKMKTHAKCGNENQGGNGKVTGYRQLMALLSKAQQEQFEKAGEAAKKVLTALADDSDSTEAKQNQFEAINNSKTEGDILSMVSTMVADIQKKVGQSLEARA
jgi:hypothetical protein